MNILISVISFINRSKPGAEIYGTFAKRTIDDVMTKTPFDIMVTTNEYDMFISDIEKWGNRVIIREEKLEEHRLVVGVFNQLLKFYSIKNIDDKYDWVLYLDCDAGLHDTWNIDLINQEIYNWEKLGYDMLATRTNAVLKYELEEYEEKEKKYEIEKSLGNLNYWEPPSLFGRKFVFYNVSTESGPFDWFDAKLPSEHIFLIKNNEKLNLMCQTFEKFCFQFETQGDPPITVDMEAFEIGVSALLSNYNMGEMGHYGEYEVFKVLFNKNNIEKVKY